MGPLPDSSLIATRLGAVRRFLCATPAYLEARGTPGDPDDLLRHDLIEMPGAEGRPRSWILTDATGRSTTVAREPRIAVNDALTIHRLVRNGAGIGGVSGYLCAPDIASGRLVRLLPGWRLPSIEVHAVFPSNRALAPAVRAFVELLRSSSAPGSSWQDDEGVS